MSYFKEHLPAFICGILFTLLIGSYWAVYFKLNAKISETKVTAEQAISGVKAIDANFQQGVINVLKGLQPQG